MADRVERYLESLWKRQTSRKGFWEFGNERSPLVDQRSLTKGTPYLPDGCLGTSLGHPISVISVHHARPRSASTFTRHHDEYTYASFI